MSIVSLDIWTAPYPSITNDITVKVYTQLAPTAVVVSATHVAPHVVQDFWSFPGLDRTNYVFRIFETASGVVVRQLGLDMNVVPASANGAGFKATAQIEADVTVGLTSGTSSFTFDGTGGTADWRGWDIDTIDRISAGPMKRNVDYTYIPGTAVFTLLNTGDVFGPFEWFNVQFAAQGTTVISTSGGSSARFSTPKIITANYSVDAGADMGGLLIIRPSGNYLELQLPDIATVVAGKVLDVEMDWSSAMKCMKLKTFTGQIIAWMSGARPDLYACPNENFSVYKFVDPSGPTNMWRIWKPFGNFLTVGQSVYDDAATANVFNKILFDGSSLDIFQYARLYNDYVLNLPLSQVCNYDDWTTGNNTNKFSLANGSSITNQFHVPDRRSTTDKNTDGTILPGVFQAGQVGAFSDPFNLPLVNTSKNAGGGALITTGPGSNSSALSFSTQIVYNAGKENRVPSVISRKYLLV